MTISIDYRLAPAFRFPAQIQDCKTAVRWLRAHAEQLYIDPDRIGVWGISAGAHLAALLGTTADRPELEGSNAGWKGHSSRVQAVVNVSGVTDFFDPGYPINTLKLFGGPVKEHPDLAHLASPVRHVTADSAAFLHLHGERDQHVFPSQAMRMHQALLEAGAQSQLEWLSGDHFINETHQNTLEAHILKFFQQQLMPASSLTPFVHKNFLAMDKH
ncbi:hypothetical protein DC3_05460 [Deinococcus cellulosilyticus NBRC 106333 = KACC 11606]|uniref:BD-FAE-like domain-containing protein n=1 Tax=Deinococcus cellulosilyticus (strain DSM 18568 / NBRC 106333 / KACC 11606 / 5516J-15) TaxID=1223518 RepID=A0A511MX11_DEIC1|nr:hypothetical protein DC3_05460 [Deinococcus cellulosilyticus NBRC 106333 = KACC 11606]